MTRLKEALYIQLLENGEARVFGSPVVQFGHKIPNGRDTDGIFGGWEWDGKVLNAYCDPWGVAPVFYWCGINEVVVARDPLEIIAIKPEIGLDFVALSLFFQLGFYIGNQTPFSGIKVLRARGMLRWDGRPAISGGPWSGKPFGSSWTDAIDGFCERFKDAVSRRLPSEPFGMPLTGGLDSRLILFELMARGHRPELCLTSRHWPPHINDEPETAAAICDVLDVPHLIVERQPRLQAELAKNEYTFFCSDEHAQMEGVARILRSRFSTTYHGIGGGELTGDNLLQEAHVHQLFTTNGLEQLIDQLVDSDRHRGVATLFPEITSVSIDEVKSMLFSEMTLHLNAAVPWFSFHIFNRMAREIGLAVSGQLAQVETVYCPFLDLELFTFLSGLPPELQRRRGMRLEALSTMYPRWTELPYTQYRPKAGWRSHMFGFYFDIAQWTLINNPRQIIRKSLLTRDLVWAFVNSDFRSRAFWLAPQRVLYAIQLESAWHSAVATRRLQST